ncbi:MULTISPECIES: hypothetical protein [unclassified Acinetobacter]|uniref:hypothetical protein n=1 Tax=unclassified Acinetobacter TaxID=196816 RepID=UPI0015D45D8E|nr:MULTISPECIES: hypothetical protein [unclassified Acinetobacter]
MMEKFRSYFNFFFVVIFGFLLLGCQPNTKNTENNAMNQQPYLIHFGPQGFKDFAQYNQGEVDNHPVASFTSLRFSAPNLGQIKIENGANSLLIDHVFNVLGTSFHKEEGIEGIDIDAGLNKEEFVRPEQAYEAYVALMKRLNEARWKNYFYRFSARIAKEDNIRYLMQSGDVIDPAYIFTDEEWKKIINNVTGNSIGYRLYANGILLNLSIKQTQKNEDGKEQYIVRYAFNTIRYDERNSMDDSENNIDTYKMTSKELEQAFTNELIRNKKSREIDEKEVIVQGYHIDENYEDPDVWQYVK